MSGFAQRGNCRRDRDENEAIGRRKVYKAKYRKGGCVTTYSLFHDAPQYATTATFPAPRPTRKRAHEALRQGAPERHRCQMLMAATGPETPSWDCAQSTRRCKGKRAIFICDRRTLIEQTSAVADSYGLTAHSVLMADHWRYDPSSPFRLPALRRSHAAKWPDVI